jgi:hypothetical protein
MSSYNYMKRADRERALSERKSEIDAIDAGTWPRDINDDMRWGVLLTFHDRAEKAGYARKCCENEVNYLEGIPARIKAGFLQNWEA